jgi:hypothetical protein
MAAFSPGIKFVEKLMVLPDAGFGYNNKSFLSYKVH